MNVELPTATKILIALTVDYRVSILGLLAGVILVALGVFFWSRSEEGGAAFDRLKFRLPLIGDTSLKFQVAQFCRTLATLLTGGTPLVAGLQTAGDAMDSALLRGSITRATQMVREGDSLNAALASTQIMPALALDMIEVGESSGALAPMLTSVAEFYEEEVNLKLSAMVSLIEPAILVFMGILVAFILISLYLPIFSFSISGASGH
jgi:type IV pilus assembly protein PilC